MDFITVFWRLFYSPLFPSISKWSLQASYILVHTERSWVAYCQSHFLWVMLEWSFLGLRVWSCLDDQRWQKGFSQAQVWCEISEASWKNFLIYAPNSDQEECSLVIFVRCFPPLLPNPQDMVSLFTLAVLELTLYTRLASNSEICLPLPPKCWD